MGRNHGFTFWAPGALVVLLVLLASSTGHGEVGTGPSHRAEPVVPGRFIVLMNGAFDPAQVAADHAAIPLHVYRVASRGFAARLSDSQVNALRSDPRVNNVVADRKMTIAAKPGTGGGGTSGETIPTGIRRIDAEGVNATDDIGNTIVAIIDTGIDLDHPDLNISDDCRYNVYGGAPEDGNGHGTHVAGTVAAKAGSGGVRGVAPGATLCPIKVLDDTGSGAWSDVMAGIEYVTDKRVKFNEKDPAGIDIKVANMSLGGCAAIVFIWCLAEPPAGNDDCGKVDGTVQDPLHQAICNSTIAGVVYSVAAGNDAANALYFVPAAYPEVITVSAIADYNGLGGGRAKAPRGCNYGPDDSLASFSNYGETVDIAAPGACILSTYKGGGTKTLSGTSMAAPHVTGAIAALQPFAVTAGDKDAPRNLAMQALSKKSQSDVSCGFSGDPDNFHEPLVYVGQSSSLNCN